MLKLLRGFSLVELIIGVAIFGILLALAMPSFSAWIRNAKVRTVAESIQNGLQLAKAEAVRRNTNVIFQLTDTADNSCALSVDGPNWVVSLDSVVAKCGSAASDTTAPRLIQLRSGAEGSDSNTTVLASQSSVVFNGMGRVTPIPAGNISVNVSNTVGGLSCIVGAPAGSAIVRCLRIVVSPAGQIRMCDPALRSTDAQGC